MAKTFFTSKGTALELGGELGKGGEGSVFEVPAHASQVAKVYHEAPDAKKQAKLRFMASSVDARLLNYIAWPQETLHPTRGGPVLGFLMPKVVGKEPIHMAYSPAHRRQTYPNAGWDFLLFVARNIAASFEAVHVHGHVIGDVNQNSFMVGRDSKVVLIDSDSFQVNAAGTLHLCEVGVSHFTPPELQGLSSFSGFTRTANHDNFGLALLLFHVLFGGRHPYSGVPLRNGVGDALETDIKHFRYAYARDNQSRGFSPPPRSIPVDILPDALEAMFHLAFTERGATGARPSAAQWVGALDGLRGRLKKCRVSSMHAYPNHLASCPWCALEKQGVVYFIDLGTTFTPSSNGFTLTQVWGLIQAVPAPPPVSVPSPDAFKVTGRPLPAGVHPRRTLIAYRLVALAFVVTILVAAPEAWLLTVIASIAAWGFLANFGATARTAETTARQRTVQDAKQEYDRLIEQAKQEAGPEGLLGKKASLAQLKDVLEGLPRAEKDELDKLHATARDRQKKKFLEACFIDTAAIHGVGPARKAALRSFGIETAADVSKNAVMQVRGFGDGLTRAVLDWKASCERRFQFNPAAAVSQSDRDAVRAKYATQRVTLERTLAAAPAELQVFRQRAATQLAVLKPQFDAAALKLAQAQADFSLL